jgi:aminoglycoside phosphotransferase (APT) family kinase protein
MGGVASRRGSSVTEALQRFFDTTLGDQVPVTVTQMAGGGSCEVFTIHRGASRWVLRRAPRHASSATAHDVLREFRILDAIKDEPVRIARPVLACADPSVFDTPFYVMEEVDGVPVRSSLPGPWAAAPETHGRALEELIDSLVEIHDIDWRECGLDDLARPGPYLSRQLSRWLTQLDSYGGRQLPTARDIAGWLERATPPEQPEALCHGDYKLDNVLFAREPPPRLLAVVDWEMASIGDPLIDLAWALIFHPGPQGTMPLGRAKEPVFVVDHLPDRDQLLGRYSERSGRDLSSIGWYEVFARWKLAIVLEGSYAKFLRGLSDKPMHEMFGGQVDLLLASAATLIEQRASI